MGREAREDLPGNADAFRSFLTLSTDDAGGKKYDFGGQVFAGAFSDDEFVRRREPVAVGRDACHVQFGVLRDQRSILSLG